MQFGSIVLLSVVPWVGLRRFSRWMFVRIPIEDAQVPANLMAGILCMIFALSLCTSKLGIFTIFGGFLAGLLFHQDRRFVEAWRSQVGRFAPVLFLPVFFGYTGLRTNVLGLTGTSD